MRELSETIDRKYIDSIDLSDWEIETDTGWEDLTSISQTVIYDEWYLETENGLNLTCADTHIVFDHDYNQVFVKDLIPNISRIITKNGVEIVTKINKLPSKSNMFDVSIASDNHRFWSNNILSHNSVTTIAFILWSVLFNDEYVVAVLANKGSLARELLGRLQKAYEHLPKWLQQGVVVWNKGSLELENGSKVFAYATSAAGVRGGSFNCVLLDEFAFLQQGLAADFFQSTYPVISSGKTTKVIIVSTPNGLNLFYKMWVDAMEKRSLYIPSEIHWSQVPGRDAKWKEETIRNTSEHNFAVEFECEFIGSSNTLISGSKLKLLTFRNPILSEDDFDIYEHPKKNNLYICVVDCSEGVGLDYSTVSVIDVTQIPYVQVAKYRNNTIPTLLFPATIFSIAMRYNEAFVLVESNNMGQQIVDALHYDLEYDNVFKVENHNIKGPTISSGFKRSVTIGLKNTKSVKKIGCANLKALIEDDKLILNDFDTISELYTFIRVKDSYAADEGQHDDLVMGLVIFGWLTTQSYFKESTNIDIRKLMTEEHDMLIEENLSAFGIIDNGLDEVLISDGHDLWSLADLPHNYHT
jgi:hypothetical protein